jgi:hypothetical protein
MTALHEYSWFELFTYGAIAAKSGTSLIEVDKIQSHIVFYPKQK